MHAKRLLQMLTVSSWRAIDAALGKVDACPDPEALLTDLRIDDGELVLEGDWAVEPSWKWMRSWAALAVISRTASTVEASAALARAITLVRLSGYPRAPQTRKFPDVRVDLAGLTGLVALEELRLSDCSVVNAQLLGTFGALQRLSIERSTGVIRLDRLGSAPLRKVHLEDLRELVDISSVAANEALRSVTIVGCHGLVTLGGPPRWDRLESLEVRLCQRLDEDTVAALRELPTTRRVLEDVGQPKRRSRPSRPSRSGDYRMETPDFVKIELTPVGGPGPALRCIVVPFGDDLLCSYSIEGEDLGDEGVMWLVNELVLVASPKSWPEPRSGWVIYRDRDTGEQAVWHYPGAEPRPGLRKGPFEQLVLETLEHARWDHLHHALALLAEVDAERALAWLLEQIEGVADPESPAERLRVAWLAVGVVATCKRAGRGAPEEVEAPLSIAREELPALRAAASPYAMQAWRELMDPPAPPREPFVASPPRAPAVTRPARPAARAAAVAPVKPPPPPPDIPAGAVARIERPLAGKAARSGPIVFMHGPLRSTVVHGVSEYQTADWTGTEDWGYRAELHRVETDDGPRWRVRVWFINAVHYGRVTMYWKTFESGDSVGTGWRKLGDDEADAVELTPGTHRGRLGSDLPAQYEPW